MHAESHGKSQGKLGGRHPQARKPYRVINPHFDWKFEELRIKEDIHHVRHYHGDAATYDCPAEMKKLAVNRRRREKVMRKTADKVLRALRKLVKTGIACGPHWVGIEKKTGEKPFDYCTKRISLGHEFVYRESPEDMPEASDYFALYVWVEFPQYACPWLDIPKLLALFDTASIRVSFADKMLDLCVNFDEEFFHLTLCLDGKPKFLDKKDDDKEKAGRRGMAGAATPS